MTTHMLWEDRPEPVRRAVLRHTGAITTATAVTGGINSAVTVILDTEAGQVLLQGGGR